MMITLGNLLTSRRLVRASSALLAGATLMAASVAIAAESVKRKFDLPASSAESALKKYSEQSGVDVVFPTDVVSGVRTNAVQGELTARDALDRLLAGTGLVATPDARSVTFAVKRDPEPAKNAPSPAVVNAASAAGSSPVRMAPLEISSTREDGLYNKPVFRTDEEAPLPYNVIDRIEIDRMGVGSLDEIMRNMTEATNYGSSFQRESSETATTGGTSYGSSNINLRNLGTDNTVVLINGRRLTSGASSDISRIPTSAIERIEILPAAAAAIYGGNSLGGAINIILRKGVSGTELTLNYGGSTRGGAAEYSASIRDSRSFNQGRSSLTLLLSYSNRDKFTMGQTPFLQRVYDRYGPTSTVRAGAGLAFEAYVLISSINFVGNPGYVRADFSTGSSILSGDSSTHPLGIPGAPTAWYAQIPAGVTNASARTLTPASFSATAGQFNQSGVWRGNRTVLYTPNTLYGLTATLDHTFRPERLFGYAEFIIGHKRASYAFPTSLGTNGLALTATDPLNPFRTGITPGFVGVPIRVVYDPIDIGESSTIQVRNAASVTLGLKGIISSRWNWTIDANGDYARQNSQAYVPVNYLQTFLTRPGPTDPGSGTRAPTPLAQRLAIYNPFTDHLANPISQADVSRLFQWNRDSGAYQRTAQINPRISGKAYELPAGALTTQLRGEVRWERSNSSQFYPMSQDMVDMLGVTQSYAPTSITRASTTTRGAAAELVAPVIGRSFRPIPLVEAAEVQGTFRRNWTNRGRGGNVTSLAGEMKFTPGITLRGSLSEGLVPLTASQIQAPTIQNNVLQPILDPLRGNVSASTLIPTLLTGGNPGLRNEFSRTRTVGVILRPGFLNNRLSLTATYGETKRFNAVGSASSSNILNFPLDYPGRLERAPLTATDQAAGYTGGAITKLDLTQINLAKTYINTIDLRANAGLTSRESSAGHFQLISSATFTDKFLTWARPHSGQVNNLATVSGQSVLGPLRWKGSVQLWWNRDPWQAGLTARYTDKYYTDATRPTPALPTATRIDGDHIGSAVYYDLQIGYKIPYGQGARGWRTWVQGTQWTLNIRNLLDRDPPFRSDSLGGYYSRFDDPRGRFISVEIKKTM